MAKGIALLLQGTTADLSATLYAVSLAARVAGKIHAGLFLPGKGGSTLRQGKELLALVVKLSQARAIPFEVHDLSAGGEPELLGFLERCRIGCLVLGVSGRRDRQRKTEWVERLRQAMTAKGRGKQTGFWTVLVDPWGREIALTVLERLLEEQGGGGGKLLLEDVAPMLSS